MKSSPAFQFYPQDFLVGTADLSAEETGAYIRLLCYQWAKGGLPNDPIKLSSMAGCHGNANVVPMHKFLVCKDGLLRNERLESVRKEQEEYRKKQATNASMRWHSDGNAVAMPVDMPNACPSSSPSSSSSSMPKSSKKNGVAFEYSESFERFWNVYPKKIGKGEAYRSWQKTDASEDFQTKLLTAVEDQKQSPQWKKDDGQFIPNPATWLNQKRWDDETKTTKKDDFSSWSKPEFK